LDLDEPVGLEPVPQRADDRRSEQEPLPHTVVRPQVDLTLAVTELDVAHPEPLVAEAAACLREQLPLAHGHRELAAPRSDDLAPCPDPVPEREPRELREARRRRRFGEE